MTTQLTFTPQNNPKDTQPNNGGEDKKPVKPDEQPTLEDFAGKPVEPYSKSAELQELKTLQSIMEMAQNRTGRMLRIRKQNQAGKELEYKEIKNIYNLAESAKSYIKRLLKFMTNEGSYLIYNPETNTVRKAREEEILKIVRDVDIDTLV